MAIAKKELEEHIRFLPLNPEANYLLVLNAQQIAMDDAASLLDMLEKTNKVNTCGAVLVFGDVNTAVKLLDITKLQEAIKAEQVKPTKGTKKNGQKPTTSTSK